MPKKIDRIMLTTDLSESSLAALDTAVTMAEAFDARLVVLHILPPAHTCLGGYDAAIMPVNLAEISANRAEEAKEKLREALAEVKHDYELVVTEALHPAREIADQAETLEADLLVMATHGRTGLSHMLFGSTAEAVVRYSRIPVLTIRSFPPGEMPPHEEDTETDGKTSAPAGKTS